MSATVNAVTSGYKVKLYSDWVKFFLNPNFSQRVAFEGPVSPFIQRLDSTHQLQVIGELRRSLEAAETAKKAYLDKDPHFTKPISTCTGGTIVGIIGIMLGTAVFGLVSLPLAPCIWTGLVAGGIVGGVQGNQMADEELENQANTAALPEFQKAFEKEVTWIRGTIPLINQEIDRIFLAPQDQFIRESNQLNLLKSHFNHIVQQHDAILQLPISDPKPIAASLLTIKQNCSGGVKILVSEETASQKQQREFNQRQETANAMFRNSVASNSAMATATNRHINNLRSNR